MARCPNCASRAAVGCLCQVADSNCWSIDGAGSAASPFTISPIFDPAGSNMLSCESDGIAAILPTDISSPPACRAYQTTNQTITDSTLTVVAMNAETYDTDGMHSNTVNNSRITFITAGVYVVVFMCSWHKNTSGDRVAYIRKNGSTKISLDSTVHGGADLDVDHNIVIQAQFAANDYVEGTVFQNSGGNLAILTKSQSPSLQAVKF